MLQRPKLGASYTAGVGLRDSEIIAGIFQNVPPSLDLPNAPPPDCTATLSPNISHIPEASETNTTSLNYQNHVAQPNAMYIKKSHDVTIRRQRLLQGHTRPMATPVLNPFDEIRTTASTPRLARHERHSASPRIWERRLSESSSPRTETAPLGIIRDWLESFSREEKSFDSLAVFFETRLREALVQTGDRMLVPNRARAAMCCHLLLKIPHLYGRFAPLMTHLIDEVLRCVYKDYPSLESGVCSEVSSPVRSSIDAQFLFREPAFFDIAEAMRRKAVRLQEELNEVTEGTGLVKVFRDRFLLWDGRNLLLRFILFRGWLRHVRTMTNGRRRLRRMRLQFWFDRFWEGVERDQEERELLARAAADAARTESAVAIQRLRVRTSRRLSMVLCDGAQKTLGATTIDDSSQAADAALKYFGLVSNRASLVHMVAAKTAKKKGGFTAKDFLRCLVDAMEEAGVSVSSAAALTKDFSTKIGLFPLFGNSDHGGDFDRFLRGTVDHLSFLAFGAELKHDAHAAFLAIRQWIEAQEPPFPTSEDLRWLQKEFGVLSDISTSLYMDKATQFDDSDRGILDKTNKPIYRQGDEDDGSRLRHSGRVDVEHLIGADGMRRGEKDRESKDKDATSNVAISSVCQLIPLLYDRLTDVCDGSLNEAHKVKVQEIGKHALIRRFGVKSIAVNYFNGLMRTVKLCTDRELRLKLFCVVFSIEMEKKGSRPALARMSSQQEVQRRQRTAGVICIFCGIWHSYFNSLQVIEATKMQQERVNTRRRVREKSRINRLSDCKLPLNKQKNLDTSLIPPSKLYEQFLRMNVKAKLSLASIKDLIPVFRKIPEFGGCRIDDLKELITRMDTFSFPGDQVMLRQGDSITPAALIVVLRGTASIYIRTGSQVNLFPGGSSNKEDLGQPVKTLDGPFVVGEGRMLTGTPANATIVAGKGGVDAVILRVFDWDELMDENNTALKGLEVNTVQRAEERTKASGLSVNSEKISIYRAFFTDVDVNRSGRVNLSELLEAIQSKGTSVSMRDVEKAFKAADKDGDLELEFDEFINMCDNLLRRGKRLFEQKRVSDVLTDLNRSFLLLESFQVAIERTFKHMASHEPHVYAELQRRIASLHKERIDVSTFMQSSLSEKGKGALIKKGASESKKKTQDDEFSPKAKRPAGSGVIVVNADEALIAAMEFWEVEHEAKGKLTRIMSARQIIGRLVSTWLNGVRQKAIDRQAWHNFLRHYSDQAQLRQILVGLVQYDDFVDLIEDAYGLSVSDVLGTTLFSNFEDFADKIAATSEEAVEASRTHLIKQVATLRIQLWCLRMLSQAQPNLKINIARRSRVVILLYIVKGYVEDGLGEAACDMDTNAKVSELLLSARTFEVNADAAFCALQSCGIRICRKQI